MSSLILFHEGPLFRLERRARILRDDPDDVVQHGAIFLLLGWVPLIVLGLIDRVQKRAPAEDLTLREADRAARDLRAAIDAPPTLDHAEQHALVERLKAALGLMAPRLHELREMDEWKRFANAAVQEELIARTEALRPKYNLDAPEGPSPENLEKAARGLADIARSELAGEDLTPDQTSFLVSLLYHQSTGWGSTAPGNPQQFDGWYPKMVFGFDLAGTEPFNPVIADVHAEPNRGVLPRWYRAAVLRLPHARALRRRARGRGARRGQRGQQPRAGLRRRRRALDSRRARACPRHADRRARQRGAARGARRARRADRLRALWRAQPDGARDRRSGSPGL